MTRILGIDPGSRITGYGVVDVIGGKCVYVASGCIRTGVDALPDRLKIIFEGVSEVIRLYQPREACIEQVFMHKNADSALKLGQARGAAITAMVMADLAVHEYTPQQIKQAVVGTGRAQKTQVAHMVTRLLNLPGEPQADAADALAAAICHAHAQASLIRLAASKVRSGRAR